jgi:adenosylmethionine-8-amino-7-oxononanoate aminotransferase
MIPFNNYRGLVLGHQQPVYQEPDYWKYGIIDHRGKKIIDPMLHAGCFMLGYTGNNEFIDTVALKLKTVKPEIAENFLSPGNPLRLNHVSYILAEQLYQLSGGYRSVFALSGSDANEGAIKLASAYHYAKEDHNRKKLVSINSGYHGSTWLTSGLGKGNLWANPFYTLSSQQDIIKIDRDFDLSAIDWNQVSSIIVETCSYGLDLVPFSNEFWNKIETIQKQYDVVVILDDIFFGGGKTGTFVGWKNLPIVPDIFTMGKGITAGYHPLSITLYNEKIHSALPKYFRWDHGFTYSFSLPGVVSVLEYLKILEKEKLLDNHTTLVDRAKQIFLQNQCKIINQFGLLFCIEIKHNKQIFCMIPINATDEYFDTLHENLKNNDFYRV